MIFDLPFCSNVAYAVPANATSTVEELVQFYDENARNLYQNFNLSLQQIPCNTTSSAQYSLARNCDDCARDYKTWLCAVTIPRCVDLSTPNTSATMHLMPRNVAQPPLFAQQPIFANDSVDVAAMGLSPDDLDRTYHNSSRNARIDEVLRPGPYKEVLPCKELCHHLLQSCPAALGFACPSQEFMLKRSYGTLDQGRLRSEEEWTCNYLGMSDPRMSGGRKKFGVAGELWVVLVLGLLMVW